MTERECVVALSDRYLNRAREAEAAGKLHEAYRCLCAAVSCAAMAQQMAAQEDAP